MYHDAKERLSNKDMKNVKINYQTQGYLVDGPLGMDSGLKFLTKGSAGAYTLALPPADLDGQELIIVSKTAFAHVVTTPAAGIANGTTGAKTTLTFAAFVGASVTLVASNGQWAVLGVSNVTVA